jgi:hypothetical protein
VFNRKVSSQAGINLAKPRGMSSQAGRPHWVKDHRDQQPNTVTDHHQEEKDNDPIQGEKARDNTQDLPIKDRVLAIPLLARSLGHLKVALRRKRIPGQEKMSRSISFAKKLKR